MKALMFAIVSLILAAAPAQAGKALLDQDYRPLAGKQVLNLRQAYGGQVLLVVNTASKCGFTPQYEGLEALHARSKVRGFQILQEVGLSVS